MSLYAEREDVENVREQSCILRCVCNDEGGGGDQRREREKEWTSKHDMFYVH